MAMTDTTARRARPSILALAAVTAIAPMSLNIVVPSVPGLATAFSVDYATAQLVVTSFIISMALGQLLIGTLSDAFGRRSVLLAGIGVFIAGSAICALAPSIEALVAGRFIQAVGGVSGMVLGRAIIRDVYDRDSSASALGYVTMVMVVAPMIAPAIGGVLVDHIDWRAVFWLLVAVGMALMLLTHARVAETMTGARQPPRPAALIGSFITLLRIRPFVGFTLTMAFASSMFFTFLAAAPFVAIELLGHSPTEYGLAFISISIAFMSGNFTAARLAPRFGSVPLIYVGCAIALVGAAVMAVFVYFGDLTIVSLFGPMMIVTYANGLAMPNTIASAVSVRPDLAGAASGLSGSIQFAIAGIATYVVAVLDDGSARPMVWQLAACGLIAAIAIVFATRGSRTDGYGSR